jgi:hypothetical protein
MLAFALVATGAGLLALPGRVLGWSDGTFSAAAEQQLFGLTNQARASAGLPALRWDSTLAGIARWRSQDMATRDYFSHNIPPTGEMVFDVMDQQGYCYRLAGENIGWNNYPDDQATDVVQTDFMNSPEHRQNIMGPAWKVAGVGAYKLADGRKFYTILFADTTGCSSAPAATATPKPTATPTPKPAATAAPEPTAAATPARTAEPTPRPTPTRTPEPTPALTPAPTPTPTPTPTPARTPEPTPELTPASTQTPTPEPTPTPALTPAPTANVVPTPGATAPVPDGSDGLPAGDPATLRVRDTAPPQGLVTGLLGGVPGLIFNP